MSRKVYLSTKGLTFQDKLYKGSLTHFLICWRPFTSSLPMVCQGAFLVDAGHQQLTSIVFSSDWSGFLYSLCMGKYFGTTVVRGLCSVLFGFYNFYYGCKSVCKCQRNMAGSKQEFSPFRWGLRAVSEDLLRRSSQPPVALLGQLGCEEL